MRSRNYVSERGYVSSVAQVKTVGGDAKDSGAEISTHVRTAEGEGVLCTRRARN